MLILTLILVIVCVGASLAAAGMTARLTREVKELERASREMRETRETRETRDVPETAALPAAPAPTPVAEPVSDPRPDLSAELRDELARVRSEDDRLRDELTRVTAESSAQRARADQLDAAMERARADEARARTQRTEIETLLGASATRTDTTVASLRRDLQPLQGLAALGAEIAKLREVATREPPRAVPPPREPVEPRPADDTRARELETTVARLEADLRATHIELGAAQAGRGHTEASLRRSEVDLASAKLGADAFAGEARLLREEVKALSAKLADAERRASVSVEETTHEPTLELPAPTPIARLSVRPRPTREAPPVKVSTWYCTSCGSMGAGEKKGPCCTPAKPAKATPSR